MCGCGLAVFHGFAKNHENSLGPEEFTAGMSVFLLGSLDEQIKCTSMRWLDFDYFTVFCTHRLAGAWMRKWTGGWMDVSSAM